MPLMSSYQTPCRCLSQKPRAGGWHYVFKYREGLQNGVEVINGCDFRTDGGYILAPPSYGDYSKNGQHIKGHYAWADGLRITDVDPPPMPADFFAVLEQGGDTTASSSEHNNNNVNVHYIEDNIAAGNNRQQMTTSITIGFGEGMRDNTLFNLANHLVKSGMAEASIQEYLKFFASKCDPPFPEKEALQKIASALSRQKNRNRGLTGDIRELVMTTSGNISTTFIHQMTTSITLADKKKANVILGRLEKEGLLERTGRIAGEYRRVETEMEKMDYLNADTSKVDLWLPFNLHKMVTILPGNIIIIAGSPNAGKTALLLNIVKNNMMKFDVHYFNSEMGGSELRVRLKKFDDITLEQWNWHPWERSDGFSDVVKPGPDKINIIDFLEVYENFYEVGGMIAAIHKKLKDGLAIIALQKNPGLDFGLGGARSIEKARLALALESGSLRIVKAKNWGGADNPNGKETRIKIIDGCKLSQQGDWHKPIKQ